MPSGLLGCGAGVLYEALIGLPPPPASAEGSAKPPNSTAAALPAAASANVAPAAADDAAAAEATAADAVAEKKRPSVFARATQVFAILYLVAAVVFSNVDLDAPKAQLQCRCTRAHVPCH